MNVFPSKHFKDWVVWPSSWQAHIKPPSGCSKVGKTPKSAPHNIIWGKQWTKSGKALQFRSASSCFRRQKRGKVMIEPYVPTKPALQSINQPAAYRSYIWKGKCPLSCPPWSGKCLQGALVTDQLYCVFSSEFISSSSYFTTAVWQLSIKQCDDVQHVCQYIKVWTMCFSGHYNYTRLREQSWPSLHTMW